MAASYIPTEKALSDLFPVMPISLSDVAFPEENAGAFKTLCKSLIQGTLYISYHALQPIPLNQWHYIQIHCKNNKGTVKLTLRSVK